ncbi:MAG: hypothetical protein AB1791_16160 [Chloroflexota bacterium]
MDADTILFHLRRFLLALAGLLFLGAMIELSFSEHTENPVQFIPFILCGLGVVAVVAALARPRRKPLLILRASMALVALGSLLGLYEHAANNLAFQLEVQPNLTSLQMITAALGGASPLLAPGVLGLAAVLAAAATYYHPALTAIAGSEVENKNLPI